MRDGTEYVRSLRDGRAVFLDGIRIADVTSHPGFAEPVRRIADGYDQALAAASDPVLTYADPATGTRYSAMWLIPRTAADLGARRAVHRFWAKGSYGLKLISDFVGTEFGGRQLQYEMFYSAPQPAVNTRMFRAYDWPGATALVDRCLGEY